MADEEADDMDVLNDLMSVRSGRYLLSSKVRRVLVPYLVETLGFQSLEDVESLGAKGFEQALTAAVPPIPKTRYRSRSRVVRSSGMLASRHRRAYALLPGLLPRKRRNYGSVRKQKPVQEARDDSDVNDDVESVANGYGSIGSDKQSIK